MKITLKPTDPSKLEVDILICFAWEDELNSIDGLSRGFLGEIKEAATREDFTGKEGQALILSGQNLISAYKFLLFGQGKKEEFSIYKLYKSVASALKKAKESKPTKIAIVLSDYWFKKHSVDKISQIVVEALRLADYKFVKYKSEEEVGKLRSVEEAILSVSPNKLSNAETGVKAAKITSDAVIFARDLINEPPEVTSPAYLAETALALAKESGGKVKVKVLEKEEIVKLGMHSYLGVSVGSDKPPKFIRLSYKPLGAKKKIVLIGKGITFDTGGLSLKSAEHMETMKLDMSGAAAVLAVFKALPDILSKVEVVGLIAACENMPGGSALKPGDILKAMNGKTIEILNTDAEGRLTLADAISYANMREKPDEIIDLATLTGACMVALGEEIAGLWGNNEKLLESLEKSASESGEMVWKMPLFAEYKPLIKSHIADVKNTQTGRYGGAITASLFLSEFVGETPWAHLDIAGPAFAEKDTPLSGVGGVGFGVRLLLSYLSGN